MGKQSRLKASSKDKKQQHHPHPDPPAAIPQEMEEAHASPPPDPFADAAPQETVAGDGKILAEQPTSPGNPSSPSAEEVQHLRTLNGILAKQMVEGRQEKDQDQVLLSDLERGTIRAALASQLSQEAGRLTRLAEGTDAAAEAAAREMEGRLAATESKWMEAVAKIERKVAAACEEAARLKKDLKELAQDKAEVEKNLRTAETEMDSIRGSLQDAREALELAQEENERFKKDVQSLLLERDENRKLLDVQTAERKALEIKISELERCHEEARRALGRAMSECRALAEDSKEKEEALLLLTQEKASLEESLAESVQMVEDLKRQMEEAVLAKDEEMKKVLLERDEAKEGLHVQMQEMKGLVVTARDVAREMLERALSQCRPPEETVEEWERDLELLMGETASEKESVLADALPFLNKLSREMVISVWAKGEELEQTKAVMEKVISMKEEEYVDLAKVNFSLNSQLATLREEHESRKTEEEGLRSQVAELNKSNGHAQKALEELRVELKKQVEEKKENTRSHQSLAEGYLQKIEDLTRKMAAAAEERDEVEKVKGKQEDEIFGLQETVALLNSEIAALRDLSGARAWENELLREEKNGVLERIGEQIEKAEALMLELRELEKSKCAIAQELGDLQTANAQLLEEKKQMERRVDSLGEEKASTQRSLADAERRLERAKEALSLMKSTAVKTASELSGEENGTQGEGEPAAAVEAEGMEEDIRRFAVAMEAIREGLSRREEEMKGMKQELKQQRETVAGVQQANACWKWLSFALATTTALAPIAFAARGR